MKNKLKNAIAISLVPQIFLIKWLSNYPDIIENYYSNGLYVQLSKSYRFLLGWIPFSVGDLLYAILTLLALYYIIKKRKYIWSNKLVFLRNCFVVLSVAYFTFNLSWGLNYYRHPIADKLEIEETKSKEELLSFIAALIKKTNDTQLSITADSTKMIVVPYSNKEIFSKTISGYQQLEKVHPFLSYEQASLKESIFSTPISYMGYGGYLNPFTNEAQVNALIPAFRFPVICGHEIGHQIGYSAENETNLIGYLATLYNDDIYFKYAAYSYALSYCLSNLKENDEKTFNSLISKVNPGVRKNYQELNDFWLRYENISEPIFKSVFNTFLKANNQEDGIKSYSKVVLLMVSYHKKHPL
ncbi:DUF3810 domain-containing protein [Cellulophaga tyrosinoxydans]|uniref:Amino acid permease n=1 Tax=Cellulophaga tyrosinoxydans TaxID=504486 RepID=A0A1W2CIE3_9FLAO|nr:DUF3810 domain-containing protein [Cellulophaga tyrosinoxydans]SMC84408.1 Protein of unknown function [Cellulophaga tyrosinoxydans]